MEAIDLDLIAQAMHSTDIDAYVSPDGASVLMSVNDSFEDDEEPDEDWLWVPRAATGEEYEDMVAFADAVVDHGAQERLRAAMTGTGAFRRFRQAVYDDPTDIGADWSAFSETRRELRALEWLGEVQVLDEETLATLVAERLAAIRDIEARLAGSHDREIAQVQDRERELQSPECRCDRRRLNELLASDFVEISISGIRRNRAQTVEALLEADPAPILMQDLESRRIADDVVIVQWVSERNGRRALRTSLWCRSPHGWQLTHHQGTALA